MLLTPKKRKHRKTFIPVLKGKAKKGYRVNFWDYGLKATQSGYISNRQLESARKVIIRHVRKIGKIRFRVFPDVPFTKKGLEMPMGKGKGDVDIYKAKVKRWKIILETTGLDHDMMAFVLKKASAKLPIKTRMVVKGELN